MYVCKLSSFLRKALGNLRKDDSHMVLTADKTVALVTIDRHLYLSNA